MRGRGWYLTGAQELRNGIAGLPAVNTASPDTIRVMPVAMFLDFLGIRLNGPKAVGTKLVINLHVTDTDEHFAVRLEHAVLDHTTGTADDADASIALTRGALDEVMAGRATVADLADRGEASVEDDAKALQRLAELLDTFEFWFDIVTP